MQARRHKHDTKTFDELSSKEQAKAMNMTALQFRKQLIAHLRSASEQGRSENDVIDRRLALLESILADYRHIAATD